MDGCTEKKERRGEEGIKDQYSYRNQYVFLSIKIFLISRQERRG